MARLLAEKDMSEWELNRFLDGLDNCPAFHSYFEAQCKLVVPKHHRWVDEPEPKDDPPEPEPDSLGLEASAPPPTKPNEPPPPPASSRLRDETEEAALRTPGSENGNNPLAPSGGQPAISQLPEGSHLPDRKGVHWCRFRKQEGNSG
jgi:hypothetical protein